MLRAKAGKYLLGTIKYLDFFCVLSCSNWQPEIDHLEPETLKEKTDSLNESTLDQNFTLNGDTIKLLNDTYASQRLFLNSKPELEVIQKEWPILLFNSGVVFWHFQKLMSLDIEDLQCKFLERENKIFKFGMENTFTQFNTIPDDENDKHQQCLQVIADYFKENIQLFITKIDKVR